MPKALLRPRTGFSWLAFLLIISLIPAAPAQAVEKALTIAFQGPLSGPEDLTGKSQLAAVQYTVNQFNKRFAGEFKVSVVQIDDQGDPAIAQKIAPTFAATTNILGIVGPSYSGATIASMPFYKTWNLPMISPSASRLSLTDPALGATGFPIFHRVAANEKSEGSALYKIATSGVINPKVIIIDDNSAYAVGLSQRIMNIASTGSIHSTISFNTPPTGVLSWTPAVNSVRSSAANVVIYTGYTPQAATLFTSLRNAGYKGVLAGGEGVNSSLIFDYATTSILEGVRLNTSTISLSQISTNLESNYRQMMGKPSDAYAAEAIDSANVLLYCIASGVTTRSQMLSCIDTFNGTSIYGHKYSFDTYGDNTKQAFYGITFKSGSIELIDVLSRNKQSAQQIISSFPWYNLKTAASGAKLTTSKIVSYIDEANNY